MKSNLERIYLVSPVILQNIFVTIKGYSIERTRHGGNYEKFLKELLSRNSWSFDSYLTYQKRKLKEMIVNAYEYVPFYKKLFKRLGLLPSDINSVKDLTKIPLLNKDAVRKNPFDFIDVRFKAENKSAYHTTGTTGTPIKIYANKVTRQWNYAFFDNFQISNGLDPKKKRATLGGRIICHPNQTSPPYWRYSPAQKNLLFSSYHMTNENLPYYIDKLEKFKPDTIDSYPSSIYILSKFILEKYRPGIISPKGIITSAATLFKEQREVIEKAFNCKVFDQYGSAEMCVFAGQCRFGKYHLRPDYGVTELIKDNDPAVPGSISEIVCTGLINNIMPLIRYRVGDLAILDTKECDCGLNTPILKEVLGRIDDFIVTPDGRKIGRLSPVLKGFPVKEAQYIQKRVDQLIVRIVKAEGFENKTEKDIEIELRKRIGSEMAVKIEKVNSIKRGPGGKLRTVISEI